MVHLGSGPQAVHQLAVHYLTLLTGLRPRSGFTDAHSASLNRRPRFFLHCRTGANLEDLTAGGADETHPLRPAAGDVPATHRTADSFDLKADLAAGNARGKVAARRVPRRGELRDERP